jgi:hypothetical protein
VSFGDSFWRWARSASLSWWSSSAFQLLEFLGVRFVLDCLQHNTLANLTIRLLGRHSAKCAGDLSMIGRRQRPVSHE